jgi:predicted PP-loop superfamily ATPase
VDGRFFLYSRQLSTTPLHEGPSAWRSTGPIPLNSLGFAKPPAETRVVVAMSGGVDSSVVAAMLAEEGL